MPPVLSEAFKLTVSVPRPASTVKLPTKAASALEMVSVSFPEPVLIRRLDSGLVKVTDSPSVESMVMLAPAASISVIVSAPPLNVKTRFVAMRLSMTGSRPV